MKFSSYQNFTQKLQKLIGLAIFPLLTVGCFANQDPNQIPPADTSVSGTGVGDITQQAQALISIEAEHYNNSTIAPGGYEWTLTTNVAGYSNAGALQALPVDTTTITTDYSTLSPQLDYQVKFSQAGTYHVWIRGIAPDGDSNSLHVGLDGQEALSTTIAGFSPFGEWVWSSGAIEVSTPGTHTVNIWMRESGMTFDKIVLATDPNEIPTGTGPLENSSGIGSTSNSSPIAAPDNAITNQDTSISVNVLANDRGLADTPVTVTILSDSSNGISTVQADNTVLYTPNSGYVGNDNITYQVTDADGDTTLASLNITVECTTCASSDVNLTLNWDPSPGDVVGYRVYYGALADNTPTQVVDTGTTSASFVAGVDLGLQPGDTVCFRVKAYNNIMESDFSDATCGVI